MRHQVNTLKSRWPSLAIFGKECKFHVEPSAITIFPKSTFGDAIKLSVNAHHIEQQTGLLNTGAELNVVSKAFFKRKWLTNIMKQHLHACTLPKKNPSLSIYYFVVHMH